jgi:translation initiation factor RLI1
MAKRKKNIFKEVEETELKQLKRFEYLICEYNEVGCSICYLRVPGGLIRTISTPESVNQLFIPLNISFFTND